MPADVPLAVRTLLRTCLEKDRRRRTVDATTALFVLDNAASLVERVMEAPAGQPVVAPAVRVPFWRRAVPVTAAVLVSASVAGYAVWTLRSEPVRPPVRFVITLPEGEQFTAIGRHAVAISPSASHIVYSANGRLNLRALDQLEARPVAGTEGSLDPTQATAGRSPVFSPDGQWIGFWQNGQLKKVSVTGGAPVTLCAADNPWGASWGADDTILLGQGPMGIMRVAGAGGTPEVLIKVEAGQSAHGPQMLPGGRAVLFTLMEGSALWDEARVVVQTLETGERKELIKGGTDARYLATGHLVYALQDSVLAVPFDADALEVTGGPVPLVEHVARAPSGTTGSAHFSISADGTLVYIPDTAGAIGVGVQRTLAWVDRQGREEPLNAPVRVYRYPRISPDGQRVALDLLDEQHDIWIWHLTGETLTRLTLDPAVEEYGVWTPDGRRVIFSSTRAGGSSLFWQAADGTGAVERLTEGQNRQFPMAVSPDGTRLVFMEDSTSSGGNSGSDLMMLLLQGERRPQPLVQTPFSERNAEISPDGRWLAYDSNESGRYEVYVRPFPNVNDGRWQVSTGGGARPLWARNGQELFYMTSTSAGDTLMSAAVVGGPPFKAGTPMKVFDAPDSAYFAFAGRAYDVSPDGRRFLLIKTAAGAERAAAPASMTVVQGWFDELRRRVPVN